MEWQNLKYEHKTKKNRSLGEDIKQIMLIFSELKRNGSQLKELEKLINGLPTTKFCKEFYDSNEERISDICKKIIPSINKKSFFYINIEIVNEVSHAYEIFHAINTINIKLTESEKFRNFIFSNISSYKNRQEITKMKETMNKFDKRVLETNDNDNTIKFASENFLINPLSKSKIFTSIIESGKIKKPHYWNDDEDLKWEKMQWLLIDNSLNKSINFFEKIGWDEELKIWYLLANSKKLKQLNLWLFHMLFTFNNKYNDIKNINEYFKDDHYISVKNEYIESVLKWMLFNNKESKREKIPGNNYEQIIKSALSHYNKNKKIQIKDFSNPEIINNYISQQDNNKINKEIKNLISDLCDITNDIENTNIAKLLFYNEKNEYLLDKTLEHIVSKNTKSNEYQLKKYNDKKHINSFYNKTFISQDINNELGNKNLFQKSKLIEEKYSKDFLSKYDKNISKITNDKTMKDFFNERKRLMNDDLKNIFFNIAKKWF